MKKVLRIILFLIALTMCILFFSACIRGNGTTDGNNSSGGVKLTEDMVTLKRDSAEYTGEPIIFDIYSFEIKVDGISADLRDFSFIYSDNVNTGTATVTVTALTSNLVYGSVDKHFTILPGTKTVYSVAEAEDALNNANYSSVTLSAKTTVADGETLIIPEGKTLQANVGIDNYGEIKVFGDFRLYTNVKIYNYGKLTVDGKLALSGGAALYNLSAGSLRGETVNNGTLYFNGEVPEGIEGGGGIIVRRPFEEAEVILEKEQVRYVKGQTGFIPGKISVKLPGGTVVDGNKYSPRYYDNDYIGCAKLTLTAPIDDAYFYGDKEAEYEIIPAAVTVTSEEELNAAFLDSEINYVTYKKNINKNTGFFTVPQNYTLDMGSGDTVYLSVGDLTVEGVLIAANLNVGILTVEKGGYVTASRDMTVRDELRNSGSILYKGGEYDKMAFGGTVLNDGSIVNKGSAFYESEIPFDVTGFDNADGKLYSYCPLDGLVNVTVKHDIANPEVMWLSYLTKPYNAEEQTPVIKKNPALGVLYANQYRVTYLRNGERTDDKSGVGIITMKIEILSRTENAYRGTALLNYEITRSAVMVNSAQALIAAAGDSNYYLVELGSDIDASSVNVAEGVELDLNGHALDVYGIENHGKIIIPDNDFTESYVPTGADCNLIFTRIENYGSIENNGLMASLPGINNGCFINHDGSEFINNGSVTVDYEMLEGARPTSGTGAMTGRRYYDDLIFTLTETEFYYDTTEKKPDVTVTLKENNQSVDNTIFKRVYDSNINAGTGKLYLYIENADIYSEYYITQNEVYSENLSLKFTIYRSEKEVGTPETLLNAVQDANYERITLTNDIELGTNGFALSENVILDCGSHLLIMDASVTPDVPETSSITADVSDITSFEQMKYVATDIKLVCDIGNNSEVVYIKAVSDYSVDLAVNLNGYDFRAEIAVGEIISVENLSLRVRFYDGSGTNTGKISGVNTADGTASYAVKTLSAGKNSATYLELENITVYGIYLESADDSSKSVTVTVTECTVSGKNDASYAVRTIGNSFGLSAEFISSTIEGYSAVYLGYREKSVKFTDCAIRGTGEYKAPSYANAGKGFAIGVYFYGTNNQVFERCNITSVNGYAVVQISGSDGPRACKLYFNGCTLSGKAGNCYAYDDEAIYIDDIPVPSSRYE